MSGNRDKRLAKLERKRRPEGETFVIWRNRAAGWTYEEAIARRFPDGVPPGAKISFFSWLTPDDPDP
jgi:hypothetical protein